MLNEILKCKIKKNYEHANLTIVAPIAPNLPFKSPFSGVLIEIGIVKIC